jgi:hypothetical protein
MTKSSVANARSRCCFRWSLRLGWRRALRRVGFHRIVELVRHGLLVPRGRIGAGLIDWFPADLGGAQDGAGGEGEIDLGDLVVGEGADFGDLGLGEACRGVEDVGAGGAAGVEGTLLALERAGVENDALSRGDDALVAGGEVVDGVERLLANRLLARGLG